MSRASTSALAFALVASGGCTTRADSIEAPTTGVAQARLGETARIGRVRITPLRVVEDSRCNTQVQCIWAGRVRIAVLVVAPGWRRERILTSNEPIAAGRGWLSLQAVCPSGITLRRIDRSTYRFTFGYFLDPAPRPTDMACAPST